MLRKIFGKGKKDQIEENTPKGDDGFVIPMEGKLLELSNVPDEVFARKMMGDGFAIEPTNGEVVSPVDGKVTMVFATKHAIGITSNNGQEILIHIGIETVNLNGEGFEMLVKEGEKVSAGKPLVRADLEYIKKNAKSIITPIIFTNLQADQKVEFEAGIQVKQGDADIISVQ